MPSDLAAKRPVPRLSERAFGGGLVADMGVVNLPGGSPDHETDRERWRGWNLPPGHEARIDLTITDDCRWRCALSSFQRPAPTT